MPLPTPIFWAKAEAGATNPFNAGPGTVALTDLGGGVFVFRASGGLKSFTLAAGSFVPGGDAYFGSDSAFIVAVRYRVQTPPTGINYPRYFGVGPAASDITIQPVAIARNNSDASTTVWAPGQANETVLGDLSGASYRTVVAVVRPGALIGDADTMSVWIDTPGRVGTAANQAVSANFGEANCTAQMVIVNAVNGAVLDFTDFALWHVNAANADLAAAADNLRANISGGNVAPTISPQPTAQTAAVGGTATFTSGAIGTPAPTGKWQANGVDIPGATSTSYSKTNCQLSDSGVNYRYVATNGVAPDATSNNALLTVTGGATVPGAPTIGAATAGNTTATFAGTAPVSDGGSAILDYQLTLLPGPLVFNNVNLGHTATGLVNDTAYSGTYKARNVVGLGAASAASNSVTPTAGAATYSVTIPAAFTDNGAQFKRLNAPFTVLVQPWNGDATSLQTAARYTFSGTSNATTGVMVVTGIPFSGSVISRPMFMSGSTILGAHTSVGTAA